MTSLALEDRLNQLVATYHTPAFIQTDPIQFPHRFLADPLTCEWVAFMAALLTYGSRPKILETIDGLLTAMGNDPRGYLENFSVKKESKRFSSFVYRFNKGEDILYLLERLQQVYRHYGSLETFLMASNASSEPLPLNTQLDRFVLAFTRLGHYQPKRTYGIRFLLGQPGSGSACKRLNLFLRWVVRQDPSSNRVDLGLWRQAFTPADLMIPLDTHVIRWGKHFGISSRKSPDWKQAEEITAYLRTLRPDDPAIYDFALFGLGVDPNKHLSSH